MIGWRKAIVLVLSVVILSTQVYLQVLKSRMSMTYLDCTTRQS